LLASHQPKNEKQVAVTRLNAKFDALKFFIKLLWEIRAIDANKIAALSAPLSEVGKMIGGWIKFIK